MNTNSKSSISTLATQCENLVTGVSSLPDPSFTLDGKVYTKAEVVMPLAAFVTAAAHAATTKAAWSQAVLDQHAAQVEARAMVAILKPYLKVRLGKKNPALQSQFGVPPAKTPQVTVAVKATSIANARATRTARHTMGPVQKKAVKGKAAQPPTPSPSPAIKPPTS